MSDQRAVFRTPGGTEREGRILRLGAIPVQEKPVSDDETIEDKPVRVRFRLSTAARLAISAGGICLSIWGAAWWTRGLLSEYANQIAGVKTDVNDVVLQLKGFKDDTAAKLAEIRDATYTLSRASEVALRQAIENPGQRIVDPRDPNKIITVRSVDHSITEGNSR